ncbi:glycosyltransferase, partial [uncultured Clostridium sp.]|uniref:glycosyltransferase n=1 Tax=uncultured Clostridium sp. TaxID=59620 RepID=UPI0025980D67
MKKYLFIIPSLSKGGAERVVAVLSSELIEQEREVTVITHFKVKDKYPISPNVKLICLSDLYEEDYRKRISTIYLIRLAKKLRKVILQEKPDYILPFLWTTCVRVDLALIFSKYKKRVIQTVRNNPKIFPSNKLMKVYRNYLVKKSIKTIVQNEEQKKYFKESLHNKIFILPNPVSNDLFNIKRVKLNNEIKIIGVGRLEKQKNFDMLIEAFRVINSKYKEAKLYIYGEGTLKNHLQQKITNNDLEGNVILQGRSNDYTEIYGDADIFALTSDFEG